MTNRGLFITFEGGDGCGKTTQIQLLANRIKSIRSIPFVVTREPGGVPAAELIRGLLVNGDAEKWQPTTEALLMSAARHEHVEQIIRPALAENKLVISDRFIDSTVVYQGIVGGVALDDIDAINRIACGDINPDVTIILDIASDVGLARAKSRGAGEDRFEAKGQAYHEKVRAGFLTVAANNPSRCTVIDASFTQDDIAEYIWQVVLPQLQTYGMIGNE